MIKKYLGVAASLILFSPLPTFASDAFPLRLELGAGVPFFNSDSDKKSLRVTDIETDTLKEKSTDNEFIFHIGLDKGINAIPQGIFSIGPHFYYQQVQYRGDVWQFGESDLNNYTYKLKNHIYDLFLEARFEFQHLSDYFLPYLLIGAGAGWVDVSYHDHARIDIPDGEVHSNNNEIRFAADAGIGFDVPLNPCWSVGAKYLYIYNGNSDMDKNHTNVGVKSLTLNTNSQNIMLTLTRNL